MIFGDKRTNFKSISTKKIVKFSTACPHRDHLLPVDDEDLVLREDPGQEAELGGVVGEELEHAHQPLLGEPVSAHQPRPVHDDVVQGGHPLAPAITQHYSKIKEHES